MIAEILIRRTFRIDEWPFPALFALVPCPGHGTKIALAGCGVDRIGGAPDAAQMIVLLFDRLKLSAFGDTR